MEKEGTPESWTIGTTCPMLKKSDKLECKNYRDITLLKCGLQNTFELNK